MTTKTDMRQRDVLITGSARNHLPAIVQDLLQRPGRIAAAHLAVGELTPFSEAQLRAQWRELTQATPLARSTLLIRIIRAEQQCMVCFQKYHPEVLEVQCPYCKSVGAKILAGEEFYLESVEEEND